MRIKNWEKFQHYKNRKPPWIKLYRDLIDDREWFCLQDASKVLLILLWIIASENDGNLPPLPTIAFRVRKREKEVKDSLSTLSHWLEQDDSNVLADCKQDAMPETERETEKEREKDPPTPQRGDFDDFWEAYPKKVGKTAAKRKWDHLKPDMNLKAKILRAVYAQKKSDQWAKDGGQFIPHPATWLNQGRWEDELINTRKPAGPSLYDKIVGGQNRADFKPEAVGGLPRL
jgi:hypothetical protein